MWDFTAGCPPTLCSISGESGQFATSPLRQVCGNLCSSLMTIKEPRNKWTVPWTAGQRWEQSVQSYLVASATSSGTKSTTRPDPIAPCKVAALGYCKVLGTARVQSPHLAGPRRPWVALRLRPAGKVREKEMYELGSPKSGQNRGGLLPAIKL